MDQDVILYVDEDVDSRFPCLYVLLSKCPVKVVNFVPSEKSHIEKNPMKTVPCMVDKDAVIWGSLAIFMYIADKFPLNALYGQSVDERAKLNSILYWCGTTLSRSILLNYVYPKTNEKYSLPGSESINKDFLELGYRNTCQQLDTIEDHHLKRTKFLYGDKETIVDYYAALILMELDKVDFSFSRWKKTSLWISEMKGKIKNVFP